jgi:hypothetical protein
MPKRAGSELASLANVGAAMLRDLALLEIDSLETLARQDADEMYLRLSRLTGSRQDPCVWDTFRAIVHEAKTGEKTKWWDWTSERKARQAQGKFVEVEL